MQYRLRTEQTNSSTICVTLLVVCNKHYYNRRRPTVLDVALAYIKPTVFDVFYTTIGIH